MIQGSLLLRLGLALSLLGLAVFHAFSAPALTDSSLQAFRTIAGDTSPSLLAAIEGLLGIIILFSLSGRIAPFVAAIYFLGAAIIAGFDLLTIKDVGLGLAALSLVFIHEEHIPLRMRNVMSRIFARR